MKNLLLIIFILTALACTAQTDVPQKGEIFTVPEWAWITPEPETETSNSCGIEAGGKVELVGYYDSETVLLKYVFQSNDPGATECIEGVYFLFPVADIMKFQEIYQSKVDAREEKRKRILELIEKQ